MPSCLFALCPRYKWRHDQTWKDSGGQSCEIGDVPSTNHTLQLLYDPNTTIKWEGALKRWEFTGERQGELYWKPPTGKR